MGEHDGDPVKGLGAGSADGIHGHGTEGAVPEAKGGEQQGEEDGGAASVTDAEGAVGEIRQGGAHGGGGDDGEPIEQGM